MVETETLCFYGCFIGLVSTLFLFFGKKDSLYYLKFRWFSLRLLDEFHTSLQIESKLLDLLYETQQMWFK